MCAARWTLNIMIFSSSTPSPAPRAMASGNPHRNERPHQQKRISARWKGRQQTVSRSPRGGKVRILWGIFSTKEDECLPIAKLQHPIIGVSASTCCTMEVYVYLSLDLATIDIRLHQVLFFRFSNHLVLRYGVTISTQCRKWRTLNGCR